MFCVFELKPQKGFFMCSDFWQPANFLKIQSLLRGPEVKKKEKNMQKYVHIKTFAKL